MPFAVYEGLIEYLVDDMIEALSFEDKWKLLERYAYLEKKKDRTETENKFLEKCETYLINIENEFKKQLDNMYKTSELDIEKEIKLFESICNIEGLDKESGVENA